jgi:hypothetical protein
MTHSYDDHAGLRPRTPAERVTALAVGAVLAVAGTVSLIHLVDQYGKAGPYREARAAEGARERLEREAERERREAAEQAASRIGSGEGLPPALSVEPANPNLPPEQRREMERLLAEQVARTPPSPSAVRRAASQPLRWYIPPNWPSVRGDAFPEGVSEISVQFRCRVTRDGLLADCAATEQPAGTGLAARMRPALDRARAEPASVDGRAVESRISFGVSFTAPARRLVAPQPPREPDAPPAYVPTSPLPSPDRLTTPAPQPAPEG